MIGADNQSAVVRKNIRDDCKYAKPQGRNLQWKIETHSGSLTLGWLFQDAKPYYHGARKHSLTELNCHVQQDTQLRATYSGD